jgi:hypothetical protein
MTAANRKLRDHMTVGWTKIVPRTLGRAYFNVVLGFVLLALLIGGIVVGSGTFDTTIVIEYVAAFLIIVAFIPRSIHGLVILRRESRRTGR